MNMFESAAYLFLPVLLVLATVFVVARLLKKRIPGKAFWGGFVAGLMALVGTAVVLYLRWNNPEGANFHKPVADAVIVPLLVVLAVPLVGGRLLKLRFSPAAYLGGCLCTVVAAGTTYGLLAAYFSG
jgi:hypothetical protein